MGRTEPTLDRIDREISRLIEYGLFVAVPAQPAAQPVKEIQQIHSAFIF